MKFHKKVVVITGGSEGLGKALARAMKQQGATVVIASNDEKRAKAARELAVDSYAVDVRLFEHVEQLKNYVIRKYDRIDIWINNAGIQIAPSPIEEVDPDKLVNLFAVNIFGYFYGCKAVIPVMKQQGSGTIININSTAGLEGKPELSAYVSSKYAVKGLTETARAELTDTSIDVIQIHPGGIKTEIYKEQYPDDLDQYMDVEYAVDQIMQNLLKDNPKKDHIIRRPKIKS